MSFTLYPDQIDFVSTIRPALAQLGKVVACAATGFGKSKTFIHIAQAAAANGRTVLILTESVKIFEQISAELTATTLINAKSDEEFLQPGGIFIGMAQTLNNRPHLLSQLVAFGKNLLCIVDEAHLGHFTKLLNNLTNAYVLGVTATPDARFATHLPEIYKGIVIGPQPDFLVQNGRLTPCKQWARALADTDKLVLQNGEFTEESQEAVFGEKKVFDGLVDDLRTIPFKKCLVFTASIKDCNAVNDQLNAAGIKSVAIHKSNKKYKVSDSELSLRMGQFKQMDTNVAVSVGMVTKGFDFDQIDLIVLRLATTSLPKYLQMIGRGSRVLDCERLLPLADRVLKRWFNVLDYGNNYIRFGLWVWDRDWKDMWNKPKKSKQGVAPIKYCPECEYLTSVSAVECQNCGHKFTKTEVPLEVGELIEITERYNNSMVGRTISSLTAEELAVYARLKNKQNFAIRVARTLNATRPKYLEQFRKAMNYKPKWVDHQMAIAEKDSGGFTDIVLN